MAARKLQSEIDKILKKVSEGVQTFEDIYESIQDASAPHKEKLETELKKEIKKLQRYRDQIKTWIGSNEIKDKRQLIENRKLIETQMEKFKACEKELKTKPFSKEGIQLAAKVDPLEKEKEELYMWINDITDKLNAQIDKCEAEMEVLQASAKKTRKSDTSKQDRLQELEKSVENHKFHIGKLEVIMRLLENESLSIEAVKNIQESVEYYVESNEDPDFLDDDSIYDELNLEDAEAFGITVADEQDASLSNDQISAMHDGAKDSIVSPTAKEKENVPTAAPIKLAGLPAGFQKVDRSELANHHNSSKAKDGSSKRGSVQSVPSNAPAMPQPGSATLVQSSSVSTPASSSAQSSATFLVNDANAIPGGVINAQDTHPAPVTPAPPQGSWAIAASSHLSGNSTGGTAVPVTDEKSKGQKKAGNATANSKFGDLKAASPHRSGAKASQPTSPQGFSSRESFAAAAANSSSLSGATESRLPPSLVDLVASFEATKERSKRDYTFLQTMLESSYRSMPDQYDLERLRYYHPVEPYPTPSYYPQQPLAAFESAALFEKFDVDTLFFIFYYHHDSYQRYLAARELKRQSWRFHKKYLTWFQRHEGPKMITDEYEQGTYIYFDFEGAWCQRKKAEFRFEYRFLEDEDLL